MNKKLGISFFLFILISLFAFLPWVHKPGVLDPWFMGFPRILWLGFLFSLIFFIFTLILALKLKDEED